MRKIPEAHGILIAAVGFYNSRRLGDEKIPEAPEILISTAGFYNSERLGDEKIPGAPLGFSSPQWNFTIQEN